MSNELREAIAFTKAVADSSSNLDWAKPIYQTCDAAQRCAQAEATLIAVINAPPTQISFGDKLLPVDTGGMRELMARISELEAQLAEARRDGARLDWLERCLFDRHWDGCLNHPSTWRMAGPYRHTLQKMHGRTLREAIDAAREKPE